MCDRLSLSGAPPRMAHDRHLRMKLGCWAKTARLRTDSVPNRTENRKLFDHRLAHCLAGKEVNSKVPTDLVKKRGFLSLDLHHY